jgi:nucleotide-binding universal stress UspA family protein
MRVKKILFRVDFSDRCAGIAPYVAATAQFFRSELTLLHVGAIKVSPGILYPARLYAALRKAFSEAAEEQMKCFVETHFPSLNLNSVIEEGDPAGLITSYAHANNIDSIMMPTHGHGPFRRFLTGSVTAKVLHDTRCPVWTFSHVKPVSHRGVCRRVLCAVDCNSAAVGVIRWAGWLARRYEAALALVHVVTGMDERSHNPSEVELRRYFCKRASSELAVFMDQAGFRGNLTVRGGSIPAKLAETARQQHADLLVIGRGHTRLALGRIRTHSLAIVREAPCPVLSI